jgi:glucokinase
MLWGIINEKSGFPRKTRFEMGLLSNFPQLLPGAAFRQAMRLLSSEVTTGVLACQNRVAQLPAALSRTFQTNILLIFAHSHSCYSAQRWVNDEPWVFPKVRGFIMQGPEAHFIGVDIGCTKVAAGWVSSAGEISHHTRAPMPVGNATAALAAVVSAIDSVRSATVENDTQSSVISGIGICAPGPLNPRTGVIVNPPNLPAWRNFPLASEIERVYKLPVRVDNDGNAAALAEALWGAGRKYRNVFCATIGTGIGTGIVCNRHIYHGRTGAAAEGGHNTIDYRGPRCGCGKLGCIEAHASGPAIARRALEKIRAGECSIILDYAEGRLDSISSEMVGRAYAAGDMLAKEVLEQTGEYLTVWLGNIIDLLEPDVMIVGGGAGAMLQPFFHEIRNRLPTWCVNSQCQEIPLVPAHYGADAGIAGGAALCGADVSGSM